MTTARLLLTAWDPGFVVPAACLLALAAYAARYRRRAGTHAPFFVLGIVSFFVALASPVGVLARGYLFSAHMLQHLLLVLAVPSLVLLGWPEDHELRSSSGNRRPHVLLAWLAGVGAMWVWHARPLCNAAALSSFVQGIQTVTLVAMGFAFWRPLLAPRRADRLETFQAVAYLFTACLACSVLGVIVTLSPVEICTAYVHPVDTLDVLPLLRDGWGLSCHADQELGGLLMWVPTCFVYGSAIIAILARYYGQERPSHWIPSGAE